MNLPYTAVVTPEGNFMWGRIDGLDPGYYTLTVAARNKYGTGPSSSTYSVHVGEPLPLAPEDLDVELDGDEATLSWAPPSDTGGLPIIGFQFKLYRGGAVVESAVLSPGELSVVRSGLDYGQSYRFQVAAITSRGTGDSTSYGFAPFRVPDAPTDVVVRLNDSALDVSWSPPVFDGGRQIDSYRIVVSPGGTSVVVTDGTSKSITGLTNDVDYTFVVYATNEAGESNASATSVPRAPVSQLLDTDGDGLPDILEERAGSNSLLADSDFDGLDDAVEVLQLAGLTSSTNPESAGDGVGDASSDADNDGLSNLAEVNGGTDPANPDTDGDGLDDGAEADAGTDPLVTDTDGDGLSDAQELDLGFDPLVGDSDDNDTEDALEPITRTIVDEDGDVTIEAAVDGAAADVIGIHAETVSGRALVGSVTASIRLVSGSFDDLNGAVGARGARPDPSAAITFELPPSHPVAGREFVAYAWDEATTSWVPADNDVQASATNHSVTVHSAALDTTYAVVDLEEWRAQARVCDAAANDDAALDVEVIVDNRPSVAYGDATGERFRAASAVLGTLRPGDEASLRTFGFDINYASRAIFLTPDFTGDYVEDGAGTSVDQVRDTLADLADADLDYTTTDESPWIGEGYAEAALGGLDVPDSGSNASHSGNGSGAGIDGCRNKAVLMVTDGLLVPAAAPTGLPTGYVPLRQRTAPPVHVIDIGPGGATAQWLRDLAQQTGGSYAHVATLDVSDLWTREHPATDPGPVDYVSDDDGDGLSNWVETHGIRTAANLNMSSEYQSATFYTDPQNADTDGDGLLDGDEVGDPLTPVEMGGWTSDEPITTYNVVSDPQSEDGDGDDIADVDEVEVGLNPLNADPDGDGLDDGGEAAWGTDPRNRDLDADGYLDGYEADHAEEGYDPLEQNERVSTETWVSQFSLGAFCGDVEVCRRPTIAWLTGNIASGVLVYGDLRDLIWSIFEGDYGNTAIIAVGFIPEIGDGIEAAAKIAKRLPDLSGAALTSARKMLFNAEDAVSFVEHMRSGYPALVTKLESRGMSGDDLARLLRDNDPVHLTRILDHPRARTAPYQGDDLPFFMTTGGEGEVFLRRQLSQPEDVRPDALYLGASRPSLCGGCRSPDAVVETTVDGEVVKELYESKVGFVRGVFANRQIAKDKALLLGDENVAKVEWHFFASARTGKIGPSERLLAALDDAGIDYYIHLPQ